MHTKRFCNKLPRIANSFSCCSSQRTWSAISRELKELLEIHGCQNNQIFEDFSVKKKYFWISVLLYFLDFWPNLRNEKNYRRSAAVRFPKKKKLFDFCIFSLEFLAISQERKELPEICWCQNDRSILGLFNFQQKI